MKKLTSSQNNVHQIVVIDAGVDYPQDLANGVASEVDVYILDRQHDGVEQITQFLKHQVSYPIELHIVAHGSPGCLRLGNAQLNLETLDYYATKIKTWFTASSAVNQPTSKTTSKISVSTLNLYGCHVAVGDAGEEFLSKLYQLTGVAIYASTAKVGQPTVGGTWSIDLQTRQQNNTAPLSAIAPETTAPFTPSTLQTYPAVFAIDLVSITNAGFQANRSSFNPVVSDDGRYVVFASLASNLVVGDTNNQGDIFVYDRELNTIERVSVADGGTQGNGNAYDPSISADGRYVAFASNSSNLVNGNTNGVYDAFVYDRETDTIERVSVSSSGESNSNVLAPTLSADGQFVAFASDASNLVSGDTNGVRDVFVYNRNTSTIERVSLASGGTQGDADSTHPSLSSDGRYVAFHSAASNLVSGDTNGLRDVFVYDRTTDTIEQISVANDGTAGDFASINASISGNGRYVAFTSYASNLVGGDTNNQADIFVYDRELNSVERISVSNSGAEGNGASQDASISTNGRYVTFRSAASNLVSGDTNGVEDIFVYDRVTNSIERVSVDENGTQANGLSLAPSISADGSQIAFASAASNLVDSDTNSRDDIFVATNEIPITVNDFNQDGFSDLVWRNYSTGENAIWFAENTNAFDSVFVNPTVSNPSWVIEGVGDFNQDGLSDLVWRNYSTGDNTIWFLDGTGSVITSQAFLDVSDPSWRIQGVGDFDADGYADDLVWRNYASGENLIWFMEDSTPQGSAVIPVPVNDSNWEIAGVGDFDGDSLKDDLIWRNYATGTNLIWFMDSNVPQGSAEVSISVPDSSWRLEGAADFDGDSRANDLLWRNYSTGDTVIWNLDGSNVVDGGAISPALTDTSWRVVA